jgi:hypothetical protein
MNNSFIIKINKDSKGNDLSLKNMPIEAAEALTVFIKNLSDIAKFKNSLDTQDIKISLSDGCIESEISYPSHRVDIDDDITNIVNGNSSTNELIKYFKSIQDKIQENGLDYSIIHRVNNTPTDLTQLFKQKKFPLKRRTKTNREISIQFISGNLYNAGGKIQSNIHIDLVDGPIKIDCTKNQAKAINNYLYESTYLSVLKTKKKERLDKYELVDYYTDSTNYELYQSLHTELRHLNPYERYSRFHDIIHDFMHEEIELERSLVKITKLIRLFDNELTEAGMLRAILVNLKSFKNNSILSENLASIASKLKIVTGKEHV